MTIFSLSYNPRETEDHAAIDKVMEAWEGKQVAETVWILRRNDGCTCQTVIDDLMENISADNDISVVEIKQETKNHNEA